MLLNLKQLLDYTNGKEFAVPAFNVYNMETVMGIMAAAEETNAPVIIQCYSRLFTNGEGAYVAPLAVGTHTRLFPSGPRRGRSGSYESFARRSNGNYDRRFRIQL